MSAALQQPRPRMNVPEFLAWSAQHEGGWQLRDGEPESMSPPSDGHGAIISELSQLISNHLVATGRACRVTVGAGVIPRRRSDATMLVPDLAVTCTAETGEHPVPDPVLLVEVLSPSHERVTRLNIWAYTTIPSVQEILVPRGNRIAAELFRRQPDGSWPEQPEQIGAAEMLRL